MDQDISGCKRGNANSRLEGRDRGRLTSEGCEDVSEDAWGGQDGYRMILQRGNTGNWGGVEGRKDHGFVMRTI